MTCDSRDAIALIFKSKLQFRTWLNKLQIDDQCELWHVFAFPFKWNDVFCSKRCRFMHCSYKKRRDRNGTVLNGTVNLLLSLDARNRGRRRFFLPLSPPSSPSKRCWLPFKKTPTQKGIGINWRIGIYQASFVWTGVILPLRNPEPFSHEKLLDP